MGKYDEAGYNDECDNCLCSSCKRDKVKDQMEQCCYKCDNCSGDGCGTEDEQNNRWANVKVIYNKIFDYLKRRNPWTTQK